MKSRTSCILVVSSVAGLMLGIGILLFLADDSDPICYGNFAQIKPGMTLAEVEELLGCPPGDYTTGPVEHNIVTVHMANGHVRKLWEHSPDVKSIHPVWQGNHGWIQVELVRDGTVRASAFIEGRPARSAWRRKIDEYVGLDR